MGDSITARLASLVSEELARHRATLFSFGAGASQWHCDCGKDGELTTRMQAIAGGEDHQAMHIAITLRQNGLDILPLALEAAVAEHVLSWDYRQQPDFDELARIVAELSGGKVYVVEADTQCDDYALVFADHPLTKREATVAYLTVDYADDTEGLARVVASLGW